MKTYPIGIVGESFDNDDGSSRQAEIMRCTIGEPAVLVRDPGNRFDPNCVRVVSARGVQIGVIARDDGWIAEVMDQGKPMAAMILSVNDGPHGAGVVIAVAPNSRTVSAPIGRDGLKPSRRPLSAGAADLEAFGRGIGCLLVIVLLIASYVWVARN